MVEIKHDGGVTFTINPQNSKLFQWAGRNKCCLYIIALTLEVSLLYYSGDWQFLLAVALLIAAQISLAFESVEANQVTTGTSTNKAVASDSE